MSTCDKCWNATFLLSYSGTRKTQEEYYSELVVQHGCSESERRGTDSASDTPQTRKEA